MEDMVFLKAIEALEQSVVGREPHLRLVNSLPATAARDPFFADSLSFFGA